MPTIQPGQDITELLRESSYREPTPSRAPSMKELALEEAYSLGRARARGELGEYHLTAREAASEVLRLERLYGTEVRQAWLSGKDLKL